MVWRMPNVLGYCGKGWTLAKRKEVFVRKFAIVLFFIGILIISNPAFSEEMLDYGAIWKGWRGGGQNAYLWGFIHGGTKVMLPLLDEIVSAKERGHKIPNDFYENIRIKTSTLFDEKKLRDVMTNLYKDPANSYIQLMDMVYIARDSLNGGEISASVLKARKYAKTNYEINKKMKNK